VQDNDPIRAAPPPQPRRGSTVEMVDRIKQQLAAPADKVENKEPPRGR
jgi:hypothetical protein